MGISYVKISKVICDKCGDGYCWNGAIISKASLIRSLREKRWSFGKRVLCPVCNGRIKPNETEGEE